MSTREGGFPTRALSRRDALIVLGGLGVGAFWHVACGAGASPRTTSASRRASEAAVCVLSPEVTEGPYYIPNHLTRRDITDHRSGLPLALHITVVDADSCKPIEHADVEIWHADATGVYSGYSGNLPPSGQPGGRAGPNPRKRFLRGHQTSDARGRVLFDTIYPGWYSGRIPHIHLKVHVGGSVVHTGQIFFNDRTSDGVYGTTAYKAHGQRDTTNASDSIYAAAGGGKAKAHLERRHGHDGFSGRITVGVRT